MSEFKTQEELELLTTDEALSLGYDEVDDLASFAPLPTAMFTFAVKSCGLETVGSEDIDAVVMELTLTELVELDTDTEENRKAVGDMPKDYKESMIVGEKKMGLKAFATMTRELAAAQGWTTLAEAMENIVGFTGTGIIKHTKWKNKDTGEIREGNRIDAKSVLWD
ncbi:MAG: hypothetical protein CMM47_00540 [Rhodospirillaceae bacterium]|nr:hypothetical protein [Rhodospirillaceae bacterium]MBM84496.1 hypothetical protein [Rhodospirillaceae bacterium]